MCPIIVYCKFGDDREDKLHNRYTLLAYRVRFDPVAPVIGIRYMLYLSIASIVV